MKIILIGGKAGAGKTTAGENIQNYLKMQNKTSVVSHFGDYVKYVSAKFYNWDGKKDKNGRELLQKVGTEIFRSHKDTFWADNLFEILCVVGKEVEFAIIPDFRFKNEYFSAIKLFDVTTIRISRDFVNNQMTKEQLNHISETELDDFAFDFYINANKVEDSVIEIHKIMEELING